MFPKINLLHRYIFGEVLRVFVFVLGCITILLMFVGVFQQATDSGLDPVEALKILPYVVPSMLPFTIPAALLLTVSVVYGRLAGDQEVTAAKSAGIHPISLMWPAFFLGALLSVCSLVLTDQVIPWSLVKVEEQLVSMMEKIFLDRLETELQFSDPQHGLHVTVSGVDGNRLINPVFRYSRHRRAHTLQAAEAIIDLDTRHQQILFRAHHYALEMPDGQRLCGHEFSDAIRWEPRQRDEKPRQLPIVAIAKEVDRLKRDRRQARMSAAIDAGFALMMADFPRLAATQARRTRGIDSEGTRFRKLNTEMHSRYAMAGSCFFFALLGTPFSMRFGKSQYLTSFLLCFVPIVCGYYPLMLGLISQSKQGNVSPEWSMWVANGVVALAAMVVMRKVIQY